MKYKIRLAVLNPADIAIRRFMPALLETSTFEFVGVGAYTAEDRFLEHMPEGKKLQEKLQQGRVKAECFTRQYGGRIFEGYQAVIEAEDVDAVYIPLPPALHAKWAERALKHNKHVLLEKPFTTAYSDTCRLVELARQNRLALHENYMFIYHGQLQAIRDIIHSGRLGEIRLSRCDFTFPRREAHDFRYDAKMGGGALLDAGGYTIRLASELLGKGTRVACAQLNTVSGFHVDVYGSGTLVNQAGEVVQVSFGMDNVYRCSLEIYGSCGELCTNRIFTAPDDFASEATVRVGKETDKIKLPADHSFRKSLEQFADLIHCTALREDEFIHILHQSALVEQFRQRALENGKG